MLSSCYTTNCIELQVFCSFKKNINVLTGRKEVYGSQIFVYDTMNLLLQVKIRFFFQWSNISWSPSALV